MTSPLCFTEVDWKAPPDTSFDGYRTKTEGRSAFEDDQRRLVRELKGGERMFEAHGNLTNTQRVTICVQRDVSELNYRFRTQDAARYAERMNPFEKIESVAALSDRLLRGYLPERH